MNYALATDNDSQMHYVHGHLMAVSLGHPNDDALACMLTSHCFGQGDMPFRLGMSLDNYTSLLNAHFPDIELPRGNFKSEYLLDVSRQPERDDLIQLMLMHSKIKNRESEWIAEIIATGCMGSHHLWQDLGLWNRVDLTNLITNNFPSLAIKNDRNMKWKKFFYKQLCNQEGIYVCRSPSCEVCPDFSFCFSPDD